MEDSIISLKTWPLSFQRSPSPCSALSLRGSVEFDPDGDQHKGSSFATDDTGETFDSTDDTWLTLVPLDTSDSDACDYYHDTFPSNFCAASGQCTNLSYNKCNDASLLDKESKATGRQGEGQRLSFFARLVHHSPTGTAVHPKQESNEAASMSSKELFPMKEAVEDSAKNKCNDSSSLDNESAATGRQGEGVCARLVPCSSTAVHPKQESNEAASVSPKKFIPMREDIEESAQIEISLEDVKQWQGADEGKAASTEEESTKQELSQPSDATTGKKVDAEKDRSTSYTIKSLLQRGRTKPPTNNFESNRSISTETRSGIRPVNSVAWSGPVFYSSNMSMTSRLTTSTKSRMGGTKIVRVTRGLKKRPGRPESDVRFLRNGPEKNFRIYI